MHLKIHQGGGIRNHDIIIVAETELVPLDNSGIDRPHSTVANDTVYVHTFHRQSKATFVISEALDAEGLFIREAIGTIQLPGDVKEIIHDSSRYTTSQYISQYPENGIIIVCNRMKVPLLQMCIMLSLFLYVLKW